MTAPTLERCLTCGEGLVREDPWTGDARCGNCGARPESVPPVLGGGQGRSSGDVDREVLVLMMLLMVFLAVAAVLAVVGTR